MNALEWTVIIELVLLGVAGILALIASMISKQDPDDPIAVFCRVFWREFLYPPLELPIDSDGPAPRQNRAAPSSRAGVSSEEDMSDDDAFYGRFKKDAKGRVKKVDLNILIEPHAPADEVAGRDGDGIKVRVTGEAGDSRSNKSLVEIVATAMGVKPYQVTLTKGHYQTRKTVQIQGVSVDELQDRLTNLPDAS